LNLKINDFMDTTSKKLHKTSNENHPFFNVHKAWHLHSKGLKPSLASFQIQLSTTDAFCLKLQFKIFF